MPALPAGSPPACAPDLTTAGEATTWMQAEEANLRAAAEHAAATCRDQPATLIPAAMAQFLYVQGRWQDGIALHQIAVTAARNAGDQAGQVRALSPLIHMQMMIGDYTNARASLNQSLTLERELGDRAGEAESLLLLGMLYTSTCDLPGEMAHCLEAWRFPGTSATTAWWPRRSTASALCSCRPGTIVLLPRRTGRPGTCIALSATRWDRLKP